MEIKNNINLKESRDQLIGKKALADKKREESIQLVKKVQVRLEKLNPKQLKILRENNIILDNILNADFERIRTDKEYLQSVLKEVIKSVVEIKEMVGEILND